MDTKKLKLVVVGGTEIRKAGGDVLCDLSFDSGDMRNKNAELCEEREKLTTELVNRFNSHEELLEALKYARRFLKSSDVDTGYIDDVIEKS